jgi:hypothetical protein
MRAPGEDCLTSRYEEARMSAQHPPDQDPDAAVPPAATPSVRDLLAACAAARTVSTPPQNPAPAEEPQQDDARRDAA